MNLNPIVFALRHPITVMVAIVAVVVGSGLAVFRMKIDIFPHLNLPVVYVAQPYGGMDPAQMEGLITNYYEYHFLYINGIHHVESRNIQGMALMKLYFHPGTNMAQAMAETIGYVEPLRRAFMPPGTVSPFVMRFDAGSVPVGYLVLSSETRSIGEIQDQALFKVRPMFASLPGVSAPPPFGGSQRTIVVRVDPDRLRAYNMSPDEVVERPHARATRSARRATSASADQMPIVPVNSMVVRSKELGNIPIRPGRTDRLPPRRGDRRGQQRHSHRLRPGQRPAGRLHPRDQAGRRLDARGRQQRSRPTCPTCRRCCPRTSRSASSSTSRPTSRGAMWSVGTEGLLGAVLTGLMVLLFLRDWRSVIVVVLNIPFALLGSVVALWLTGQTINLMTLGGLALAVGILVDEATVEVENIHTQLEHTPSIARAVRRGNQRNGRPPACWRCSACWRSSFRRSSCKGRPGRCSSRCRWPSASRWWPRYLLSSTFVPVLSIWLLRHHHQPRESDAGRLLVCPATRWLREALAFADAAAVGDGAGLSRAAGAGDRAGGRPSRPGDLSHGRRRAVPAPDAGARRHADRRDRADGHRRAGRDQGDGRPRQRRDLGRLRRADPVELPDQHHLPVDERARRRRSCASP